MEEILLRLKLDVIWQGKLPYYTSDCAESRYLFYMGQWFQWVVSFSGYVTKCNEK